MESLYIRRWALSIFIFGAAVAIASQRSGLPEAARPTIDEGPSKSYGGYDWMARHRAVVDRIKRGNVDLILIGDSITHMWGGVPPSSGPDRGEYLWERHFGSRNAVNLGFGWDRTQNVLWRLQNGEIDGIHPKVAVVMIGTNNLGTDTTDAIFTGISTIVNTLRRKLSGTKILLLGIFPRDQRPDTPLRKQIAAVNARLSVLGRERGVTFLDIGQKFLDPDGTISTATMPDFLHPSEEGFGIWARAMEPTLAELFGDEPRD